MLDVLVHASMDVWGAGDTRDACFRKKIGAKRVTWHTETSLHRRLASITFCQTHYHASMTDTSQDPNNRLELWRTMPEQNARAE